MDQEIHLMGIVKGDGHQTKELIFGDAFTLFDFEEIITIFRTFITKIYL